MKFKTWSNCFLLFVLAQFNISCNPSDPGNFDLTKLYEEKDDLTLSIETRADGSGKKLSEIFLSDGESKNLFAVLRNKKNNHVLSSIETTWSLEKGEGSFSHEKSPHTKFTSTPFDERDYDKCKSEKITVNHPTFPLKEGLKVTICHSPFDNPSLIEWYSSSDYDSNIVTSPYADDQLKIERVYSRVGKNNLDTLFKKEPYLTFNNDPALKSYASFYFDGDASFYSDDKVNLKKGDPRTIIVVFSPAKRVGPSVMALLGLGGLGIREMNDLLIDQEGRLFTNFSNKDFTTYSTWDYQNSPKISDDDESPNIITNRYDGKFYSLYLNGSLAQTIKIPLNTEYSNLYVGQSSWLTKNGGPTPFNGSIYEILIFKNSLREEELEQIHSILLQKYR